MTVTSGILTIDQIIDGTQSPPLYLFSLRNSIGTGGSVLTVVLDGIVSAEAFGAPTVTGGGTTIRGVAIGEVAIGVLAIGASQ